MSRKKVLRKQGKKLPKNMSKKFFWGSCGGKDGSLYTWNISQGGLAPPYYIILQLLFFQPLQGGPRVWLSTKSTFFLLNATLSCPLLHLLLLIRNKTYPGYTHKKSHPLFLSFDVHICPVLAFILFPSITEECRKKCILEKKQATTLLQHI